MLFVFCLFCMLCFIRIHVCMFACLLNLHGHYHNPMSILQKSHRASTSNCLTPQRYLLSYIHIILCFMFACFLVVSVYTRIPSPFHICILLLQLSMLGWVFLIPLYASAIQRCIYLHHHSPCCLFSLCNLYLFVSCTRCKMSISFCLTRTNPHLFHCCICNAIDQPIAINHHVCCFLNPLTFTFITFICTVSTDPYLCINMPLTTLSFVLSLIHGFYYICCCSCWSCTFTLIVLVQFFLNLDQCGTCMSLILFFFCFFVFTNNCILLFHY
jgi:hypothetical protein